MSDIPVDSVLAKLNEDCCRTTRARGQAVNPFAIARSAMLNAIAEVATRNAQVAALCDRMADMFRAFIAGPVDDSTSSAFRQIYLDSMALAMPTLTAWLKQHWALQGVTSSHSLNSIREEDLQCIEVMESGDPTVAEYLQQMRDRLAQVISPPDVVAYSQTFELFGEMLVYLALKKCFPTVEKLDEKHGTVGAQPDFKCTWDSKDFYVEVKALDVVDGVQRHAEFLEDALETQIELEAKSKTSSVAIAEQELAPFRKAHSDKGYDPRSLIRAIDTFRVRLRERFRSTQFAHGPTIAVAVCDRLIVPAGKHSLAPYYYDAHDGGALISGVLWHACFGTEGTPIFRAPDFPGAETLEGHLKLPGVFVDVGRPFPGVGFVAMNHGHPDRGLYGLFDDRHAAVGSWGPDDTWAILEKLCTALNDRSHRMVQQLGFVP